MEANTLLTALLTALALPFLAVALVRVLVHWLRRSLQATAKQAAKDLTGKELNEVNREISELHEGIRRLDP